ncbi:Rmf/CrpP fold protein [Streptomyces boncukensis]|uniref:Rmf/CrpP fold protein n=1 Tax=Streptomyces boncukensis TaxID=2711219 RepID=UPI0030BA0363
MGTREDIVRAVTAGREAGERGDRPTVCPYPRESILRRAWIRGYAETHPVRDRAE